MPRYPGYMPFQYFRPYNYNYNYRPHAPSQSSSPPPSPQALEEPPKYESKSKPESKSESPVWFDLFGIKLYFDDVLILSLLFFLYREQVKDEGLFLALVMLLIS